ncbi:MAG TPA: glycoside hydrolase family 43 protein [Polyangiaceae bacterium]
MRTRPTSSDRHCSRMFVSAVALAAVVFAAGCGSDSGSDGDEDYTDGTWDSALTPEDAVLDETLTAADENSDDDVDEELDPTEAEDDDDAAESASVASEDDSQTLDEGSLTVESSGPKTYRNAVLSSCADPGTIKLGEDSYLTSCTGNGYPLFRSTDLVHWSDAGHIFTAKTRPGWAKGNYWAPEIHHVGSRLVAYFAALSAKTGKMCIGAAPMEAGKFKDIGRPLLCNSHVGLIDPNVFTDGSGRHFLYFKTDSNALRPQEPTVIYGHQLGADGVSFKPGKSKALIRNRLGWEGDVVEAPWMMQRGKYTYMFYSGFTYCNGSYAVGVARATSPLGTFHKKGAPILRTNAGWYGPGHNSVTTRDGHDYIVYHAWKGKHSCSDKGEHRELLVDRIAWKNGWPSVNNGTPSRTARPLP